MKKHDCWDIEEIRENFIKGYISADQLVKARLALRDTTEVLQVVTSRLARRGIRLATKCDKTPG